MKNVKSLLSIALCICLIATAFVGCSKKISLEGSWVTTIDLSQEINDAMNSQIDDGALEFMDKITDSFSVDIIYTFDEDNSYTISVDKDKLYTDLSAYMDKTIDIVLEATYQFAESQGSTRDEIDEYYMSEYGVDLRSSIADQIDINDTVQEIVDDFTQKDSQPTIIEGDRFYETDDFGNKISYETFTLDDNVLTITGGYDMNDQPSDDFDNYPLVLTRQ